MFYKFIHLHVHSEYSLDVGFFNINDYVKFCYEKHMPAAAITEKFNLASSIKFYNECIKFGIKPIIGCELLLEKENNINNSKIILIAKTFLGYKNLIKLISQSHLNSKNNIPIIKKKWLPFFSKDLIAIGISFESDISKYIIKNNISDAKNAINFWMTSFKNDYFLSLTRFNINIENEYIEKLYYFTKKNKINLIATNEVCFLKKNDFLSYKTKIKTLENNKKLQLNEIYIKEKYFKSSNEMLKIFFNKKELLYNTFEIIKKCNIHINFKDYSPKFNILKTNSSQYLKKKTVEKLLIYLNKLDKNIWKIYIDRFKKEINTIITVDFPDYFLITNDFIEKSKKNEILIGPGRGSGSGSLIAYLLSITNINPINFNLLFERFLNINRISKPDFDIDFCIEGRDLIIDYIFTKYGQKKVAQIITFGIMAAKAAIRDVGRALCYPYFFIDKIAKLISNNIGISIKSEIIENNIIKNEYNNNTDIQLIINLALKLEGMIKNIGKHAGGLIISNINFSEILPIYLECNENKFLTNFDKNDLEKIGFSKFDFLGLKTLTLLKSIEDSIKSYFKNLNLKIINNKKFYHDEKTFILFQRADTLGIFQLESIGTKSVIQKMKPEKFLDIVAIIALYRPGPLQSGMLSSFINRKIGIEKIDYIHSLLKAILSETYGMLIYQEQIMLIAQLIGNYDIGFADFLRIAMSKKKKRDIQIHLEIFKDGAKKNNISEEIAVKIFNLIEKFAGYGFNKAHSVGYATLTYNSADLKTHYNTFFITALLSSEIDNQNNIKNFIEECSYFSIKILNPDINRSFYSFTIVNKNKIRYGFGAIKGLGKIAISEIIYNRSIFGYFNSFFDFIYRINSDILTKRVLESLIYSECFNKLNIVKFKLVLISAKIIDIYIILNNNFKTDNSFINNCFNNSLKSFNNILEYKQEEIKEIKKILENTKNKLKYYNYEFNCIKKLITKNTNIICGIINDIKIKKNYIKINIENNEEIINIFYTYNRYKNNEKYLKINNILILGYHIINKNNYEIFTENFFLFRYKFIKTLEIILETNFITEIFINYLIKNFFSFIQGCTKIIFKIPFKGKYTITKINLNIKIYLHDDCINSLLTFKEIKEIKINYEF